MVKTPDAEPDLIQKVAVALAANGREDEAIEVLDSGLKRLGEIPSLVTKALEIEVTAGRYDAALTRVEGMQKSAPRPEPWMAKRAEILTRAGRTGEANGAWQALVVHLQSLPEQERGSNSMYLLMEQSRNALAASQSPFTPAATPKHRHPLDENAQR